MDVRACVRLYECQYIDTRTRTHTRIGSPECIFWFNKDSRLSIASVSIPYGQRFIEVDIENQANILFVAPGNLFLRFSVEQQISSNVTGGLPTAIDVTIVNKWVTKTPALANNSVIDTTQQISNIDLYINNIFVNPEVHDIYIRRIGFSLIRVHRFQSDRQSTSTANVLLSNLKWPIETIYLGLRPSINISAANPNQYRDWHHMTALVDEVINCKSSSESEFVVDSVAFDAAGIFNKFNSSEIVDKRVLYPRVTKTIETLQLTAHGIDIFKTFKAAFFNDYMPYTFGGLNVIVPKDEGAMMLNMCLYPGTYQPSGHINVSRAREFYLQFTSEYVSPSTQADLLVLAIAINFLLISDGSAVLRYST